MQETPPIQLSKQPPIVSSYAPQYGEIFLCDSLTSGVQSIHGFKGKKILNISSGAKKTFIFEDSSESENIVSALHDPMQDICEFNGRTTLPIQQMIAEFEVSDKIVMIANGQSHNAILTQAGRVYTFGFGEYGTLGQGGSIFEERPRLIKKLENRTIVSLACGLYHTLALSDIGDVYAWGRGFEGQLGILQDIECSSSPFLISSYFKKVGNQHKKVQKNRIESISCGAYHSIAIDSEGQLFSWGQARYGQTGTGKRIRDPLPTLVAIQKEGQPQKAKLAAGGFGHTLCLTTQGDIFSWGLNVKGQLGLGQYLRKTNNVKGKGAIYTPTHVECDASGNKLPQFKYIACGFNRSFAIDVDGNAWAWGGGNIGFKDSSIETSPRKIVESTEDRKFSYIMANEDSVVMFAPIRTTSFRPNLTPSKGNTELTFFGTGFISTGQQRVKFKLGDAQIELDTVNFDGQTSTFYCKAPDFEAYHTKFPASCDVLISLDGISFIPFEQKLFIYPAQLATHSISPKCGSIQGGMDIKLGAQISPDILKVVSHITVGFKQINANDKKLDQNANSAEIQTQVEESKRSKSWICVEGTFANGQILCKAPKVPSYKPDFPYYHVDISLNGQQFTGMPSTFRFYQIKNIVVNLAEGLPEGGYEMVVSADGLFSSNELKLALRANVKHLDQELQLGREIESFNWDKVTKKISFKMPPITWLIGDRESTPELLASIKQVHIKLLFTLSGIEWIQASEFKFVDPPPPPPEPEEEKKDSKKDTKKAAKK